MNEGAYDERRLRDFLAGRTRGFSRRNLLALTAAVGAGAAIPGPALAAGPIVKPLPPELFRQLGTNAETKWSALKDQGYYVPVDRFFVRNHTVTPAIDASTWSLELSGSGLAQAAHFSLDDLKRLPRETRPVAIECAGNGRSYYTSQQGQTVSGTAWGLGGIGVGKWTGVRLSTVLRRAGISRKTVDVQPIGLDPNFVSGGVDLGPVRRPLPVGKAFDDVLLAYELNGEPLPPDHGFPVRVVVPHWIGISSIKWVGRIDVSTEPLFSPWNTQFYRLFGEGYPAEGQPFDRQVIKSAFELDPGTTFTAGVRTRLTGARGRRTARSGTSRSAPTGVRRGGGPARTAPPRVGSGSAGRSTGRRRPGSTPCWRGPPTYAGTPSPTRPGTTRSVTSSTRWSVCR